MIYSYRTKGTCSSEIELEIKDENGVKIIERADFIGGCGGNTQGISVLVKGMKADEAISKLKGIMCGRKGTSCPDQLSVAIEQVLEIIDKDKSMPNYMKTYEKWLNYPGLDSKTRAELALINSDENKIKEWFFAPLEFGTGGLRGIMRPGINSMNVYVVKQATQAMANLINSQGREFAEKGAVIAYDSRNNSELFAKEAAKTFAANGIKVYIFDDIRPTPELSFAIRYLNCAAGINITASHNPKEYNGYKAYWEDGGQLPPDHAQTVSDIINKTDIFTEVMTCHYGEMIKQGKINIIDEEIDEEYLKNVMSQSVRTDAIKNAGEDFKIVYTPLHGAGYKLIPEVLKRKGLKNLLTVDNQMKPDGNFPTVKFPNPEFKEVFEKGIEIAKSNNCALIIGTDPDADRMGIAVRTAENGDYATMTGNQAGALLLDYIINAKKESGTLKKSDCVIKTIVTTELAAKICEVNNVKIINVLTGFKFIGEKIKQFEEESGENTFLFGYEESYGYLAGTYARDKDAVVAAMLIAEMAAYYNTKNMNLYDALQNLYKKYGYYGEAVENIEFAGIDGIEKMKNIMADLRKSPPEKIGGYKITEIRDYETSEIKNIATGLISETDLPKSDVLYFNLENGSKVIIRPSGTEPKIKIYYLISAECEKSAKEQSDKLKSEMLKIIGV